MRAAAFGLNQVKVSEYYIETCRGKDAMPRVSTNMEIMKILIQNYLQEIFLKNIHLPQNTSGTPTRGAPTQILCAQQLIV